jgi:hypothetical protein
VIAAEGVFGVEGFAAGVCWGGVAGLARSPVAADGTTEPTAAEGTGVDGFAAGPCDDGVLRLFPRAGDGVDVAGVIAAEGADEDLAGGAVDGDVGATAFAAGACDGAADGLLGAIAAEGVLGVDGVPVADGRG